MDLTPPIQAVLSQFSKDEDPKNAANFLTYFMGRIISDHGEDFALDMLFQLQKNMHEKNILTIQITKTR